MGREGSGKGKEKGRRNGKGEGWGVAAFILISHGIHLSTRSRKEMLCSSFLSETHSHISLYVQNMLRGLKREIAEKAQEKKALEQRREECIEM